MAMTPQIDVNKLSELSDFEKASIEIDSLISQLQVFGYDIRINNHNLGDYHNIMIWKYVPFIKLFGHTYYRRKYINGDSFRFPSEKDKFVNMLKSELWQMGEL
jgi:TPP-dependent 2-oxoacid decarboxylase